MRARRSTRSVRSPIGLERQPHQKVEGEGARRLLQRRPITGAVVERRRGQRGGGLERHVRVIHVVASLRD
jgi:hypothetical protein